MPLFFLSKTGASFLDVQFGQFHDTNFNIYVVEVIFLLLKGWRGVWSGAKYRSKCIAIFDPNFDFCPPWFMSCQILAVFCAGSKIHTRYMKKI